MKPDCAIREFTSFMTTQNPNVVMLLLTNAFSALHAITEDDPLQYKLRFRVKGIYCDCNTVEVLIFETEQKDVYIVEIRRISGSIIDFSDIYLKLMEEQYGIAALNDYAEIE